MSNPPRSAPPLETTIHWSPTDSPKVGLILTRDRGLALIATQTIQAGERLMAFDGNSYEWGNSTLNLANKPPLFLRDHCIQTGEGTSRDSTGLARYANHCCAPNCGITDGIWITAMVDIQPGTDLTWDYAMTEDNDWQMKCSCGSPGCRGLITGYRGLPPERRRAYTGFISGWLLEKPRPWLAPGSAAPAQIAKAG